jgi:hypothetical protein
MIQYWSFWNYAGFISYQNDLIILSPPLQASILFTSIVGGYMTYVYPRRLTIKYNKIKYRVPYYQMVLGDIFFHQYPLVCTMMIKKNCKYDRCGLYVLYPFSLWYCGVSLLKLNKDKLYGIKFNYLLAACSSILGSYGLFYHYNKNKIN